MRENSKHIILVFDHRALTEEEWELLTPCERILDAYDFHRSQILELPTPTSHGNNIYTHICYSDVSPFILKCFFLVQFFFSVIPAIFLIKGHLSKWLDAKDRDPRPAAVAKRFLVLLDQHFPECGAEDRLLSFATLLHPYYRGHMLKPVKAYDRTIEMLVDYHPSTLEWRREQARLHQIQPDDRDDIDRIIMEEIRKASSSSVG